MKPTDGRLDPVGAETLKRLGSAPQFNRWMFERLKPWVGRNVLEIGSGLGNMSAFLVEYDNVVLSDRDDNYLRILEERFADRSNVSVRKLELPLADGMSSEFDSVVCLNVVEHIERDADALRAMGRMLLPGGKIVILVPAFQWLFGTLDTALGHFRRYTRRTLRETFERAGFEMIHSEYFNMAAMPGWWVTGRLLRRQLIPQSSLRLFETLIPIFRMEKLLPFRVGQSVIGIGEVKR